jgi:hypothetical protein
VVHIPRLWYVYHRNGSSLEPPYNRDLHRMAGLKLCLMSRSTLFRRNPGHRVQLRSWRSISVQTTNIMDIFLRVLVDESIFSSKGRVEGLCYGAAHLYHVRNYILVCASNGHELWTIWGRLCRHDDVRPVKSALCRTQH